MGEASMTSPPSPQASDVPPEASVRKLSRAGLAKRLLLSVLVFIVFGELLARGICWCRKAPIFSSDCVWYVFYPHLHTTGLDAAVISNTDDIYDVLMVGGSTISDSFSWVSKHLKKGLEDRLNRPVRVFNLAASCHNTRDSLLKCRFLAQKHFDLVVVYDGINDTRMNNAPPGEFRDDYSHCIWYKHLNNLDRHPQLFRSALPFLLLYTKDCVAQACGLAWFVPPRDASPELLEFGRIIRTREPFQNHLREIIARAKSKGERIVLMTFAAYVPANYSLQAYRDGELDYEPDQCTGCPVEIWGKPENVLAALAQHNQAIRELAAENQAVIFVDQETRIPHSATFFKDCCHFTKVGARRFTTNLLQGLEEAGLFSN
jgi:hypothetical protein